MYRIIHTAIIIAMASLFFYVAGTLLDWQWAPLAFNPEENHHPAVEPAVGFLSSIFGQRNVEWYAGTFPYFMAPIGGVIVGDWLVRKISGRKGDE